MFDSRKMADRLNEVIVNNNNTISQYTNIDNVTIQDYNNMLS